MSITVRVPAPLRRLTRGQAKVEAEGATIAELMDRLDEEYPGLRDRLVDEGGRVRLYVNFYVNEEDIRFLDGTATKLKDGDVLSIVPAIAGG